MNETSKSILVNSDNLEYLKSIPDNSIESCVTDPPYGLKFMGNKWDYSVPTIELWKEVLRVLKPGSHALVFCGTRTQHRMVCNLEDAGFEIRDVITWMYGSGFPKSLNISKQIDSQLLMGNGGTRNLKNVEQTYGEGHYELIGVNNGILGEKTVFNRRHLTAQTEPAKEWDGWGTALKPACEFITLVRKPISEKNIALNILKWGVGGINIDDSRVELNGEVVDINELEIWSGFGQGIKPKYEKDINNEGRWPANLIHDGSDEVLSQFPETKSGSASRFFYCAKPSVSEKNDGLDSDMKVASIRDAEGDKENWDLSEGKVRERFVTKPHANFHPTVKPIALMQYLVRLITPKGGTVIDPYMGSGSTGVACSLLDNRFVGIELNEDYYNIAVGRINK